MICLALCINILQMFMHTHIIFDERHLYKCGMCKSLRTLLVVKCRNLINLLVLINRLTSQEYKFCSIVIFPTLQACPYT